MSTDEDIYSSGLIIPYYLNFPLQLNLFRKIRNHYKRYSNSVNILAITSSTSFIESILYDCFEYFFLKIRSESNNSHLINKLIDYNEDNLSNFTFRNYEDLSKKLLSCSLKDFTTNNIWEGISILFLLRNQVVHGRHFAYNFTISFQKNESDTELMYSYKTVHEYLIRKKLSSKKSLQLFSNEIAEHFISLTILFFIDISKNMSDKYELDLHFSHDEIKNQLLEFTEINSIV